MQRKKRRYQKIKFKNLQKYKSQSYGIESGSGDTCTAKAGVYSFDPAYSSNANLIYGSVPVVSLGLPADFAEDQYGSKFVYIVDRMATYQSLTNSSVNFGTITGSGITIMENGVTITNNALFAIISYGKNKFYAFDTDAINFRNISSSDNEKENGFTDIVNNMVMMNSTFINKNKDKKDIVFDDYIFFKNKSDVINDFNANSLILCLNDNAFYGGAIVSYEQVVHSVSVCANNNLIRPVKKCGKDGVWVYLKSCP
jgi:hypothetical protein